MGRWRATPADLREVHALIERVETKLLAELSKLESQLETRSQSADAEAKQWRAEHQQQHATERTRRWQVAAWMVTTLITAVGVLIAIVAALRG